MRKTWATPKPTHTLDVEGIDADAQKLILLSHALAYRSSISLSQLHVEGITNITQKEIQYARELGLRYQTACHCEVDGWKIVLRARVHPTLVPERSLLANVGGAFNAVCVIGDAVGPTLFYGQGAGEMPTASAVVADIIDAAKSAQQGVSTPISQAWLAGAQAEVDICSIDDIETRYYIRFVVADRPGVLAKIGTILGNWHISIASVIQKDPHGMETVSLVMLTHTAREKNMKAALAEIYTLEEVKEDAQLITD